MADVLVVDDDDDLSELVGLVLEANGHHVRRAADGRKGLEQMRARLPDVVVLDVEMPHLSGPDMAYRMFVEDSGKEFVPIVLVSGVVGLEEVADAVGTPYFLVKPGDAERLSSMIDLALRERRAPVPRFGPPASTSP